MQLSDVEKHTLWHKMEYSDVVNQHTLRPHEKDKKFFEWIKYDDKFDMLVVLLNMIEDPAGWNDSLILSKLRERKLNKIIPNEKSI